MFDNFKNPHLQLAVKNICVWPRPQFSEHNLSINACMFYFFLQFGMSMCPIYIKQSVVISLILCLPIIFRGVLWGVDKIILKIGYHWTEIWGHQNSKVYIFTVSCFILVLFIIFPKIPSSKSNFVQERMVFPRPMVSAVSTFWNPVFNTNVCFV